MHAEVEWEKNNSKETFPHTHTAVSGGVKWKIKNSLLSTSVSGGVVRIEVDVEHVF